ncbi:MAG: alpha,alpha-trehalase TreF [Chitinophagales bacterium]
MKTAPLIIWFVLTVGSVRAQQLTPRQLYGELFDSVQLNSVFHDQKTFVDCTPKQEPREIVSAYQSEKNQPDFDLKKFVPDHFNPPVEKSSTYQSDVNAGVVKHIEDLWVALLRNPDEEFSSDPSLLPLPHPYIVPGGRFREIYYWDSYFTMLGLEESGDTSIIEDMVKNFGYLIDEYGFIPNGNRTYYLSRSQPPFFSLMVELLADLKGEKIYQQFLPELLKEYNFWMKGRETLSAGKAINHSVNLNGEILNRYFDHDSVPREESFFQDVEEAKTSSQSQKEFYNNARTGAESGWDFSSRWFADERRLATIQITQLIPIDLNCLLYHLEHTIAKAYEVSNDQASSARFNSKAEARKQAIQKFCWNDSLKFFCDYNFIQKKSSGNLTLAAMFPLYFQIATDKQASQVKKELKKKFLMPGGVVTTLNNTGQQWDAPNGWAPLEYITIEGLNHYNQRQLAKKIARRWIALNVKVFVSTGRLMEKYNVEDVNLTGGGGEYPLQDGFGWTNGVLLKLIREYGYRE